MSRRSGGRGPDPRGSAGLYADTREIRTKLAEKLKATGVRELKAKGLGVEACGSIIVFVRVNNGTGSLCRGRCGIRGCVACDRVVAAEEHRRLERRFNEELARGSPMVFLTLTMVHNLRDSLRSMRKAFREAWKRLSNRAIRKAVESYFRRVEIERNRKHGWNVHFHLLLVLKPHTALAKLPMNRLEDRFRQNWREITTKLGRPSYVVRLERVRDRKGARGVIPEMTKYVTKQITSKTSGASVGLLDFTREELMEYFFGVKHWHVSKYGGAWRARNKADEALKEGQEKTGREYTLEGISELERKLSAGVLSRAEALEWIADRPVVAAILEREGFGALACSLMSGRWEWVDRETSEVFTD